MEQRTARGPDAIQIINVSVRFLASPSTRPTPPPPRRARCEPRPDRSATPDRVPDRPACRVAQVTMTERIRRGASHSEMHPVVSSRPLGHAQFRHRRSAGFRVPSLAPQGGWRRPGTYAVSYTHLDVYKRQHQDDFLHEHGRFPSFVFENLGGSLSLVDCECVAASGAAICDHARRYYIETDTVGDPPIFWRFDSAVLPTPHRVEEKATRSGDRCHRNLYGIPDKILKRLFKWSDTSRTRIRDVSEFTFCAADGMRPLTISDIPNKQGHTENNA